MVQKNEMIFTAVDEIYAVCGIITAWIVSMYFARGSIYGVKTDSLSSNGASFTTISFVISPFSHTYVIIVIVIRKSSCSAFNSFPDMNSEKRLTAFFLSTPTIERMKTATLLPHALFESRVFHCHTKGICIRFFCPLGIVKHFHEEQIGHLLQDG